MFQYINYLITNNFCIQKIFSRSGDKCSDYGFEVTLPSFAFCCIERYLLRWEMWFGYYKRILQYFKAIGVGAGEGIHYSL